MRTPFSQALAVSLTRSKMRQAEHSYSTTPSLLPIHPRLPLLLLLLLVVLIEHVNLKCRRLALPKKNSEIFFKNSGCFFSSPLGKAAYHAHKGYQPLAIRQDHISHPSPRIHARLKERQLRHYVLPEARRPAWDARLRRRQHSSCSVPGLVAEVSSRVARRAAGFGTRTRTADARSAEIADDELVVFE